MAPAKGKDGPLELCTSVITLGSSIAVKVLDYLSIAKDPPIGFNKLAIEFLETSRVIIPARAGLSQASRSGANLPSHVTNDLREQFRLVNNAFTVLNQVVSRYLDSERKSGFGKLREGFRMMFADSEIDKLRLSLIQCRDALARSVKAQSWTLGENQVEPAAGIGYVALAAVLHQPDPTRGNAPEQASHQVTSTRTLPDVPLLPSAPIGEFYTTTIPSRPNVATHAVPERAVFDSDRIRDSFSRETSNMSGGTTNTFASHGSSMALHGDHVSEITGRTSIGGADEAIYPQDQLNGLPKQAVRIPADPSKAPRWTPKHPTATVSAGSKTALLAAVQHQNHKMVEQLLDCGVPADEGDGRNLLMVAIVNHDLTTVRLLLLFGADPNAKDKDGYTPLFSATQASFFEAAQFLLKYGADPNFSAGPYKENAFARSINSGQTQFADLYLKYGAETDTIMGNGNTPFIQAINKTVDIRLIDLMLLYNADPNCKNGRGETALFKAINVERLDIVATLIDHGALPNLPGPKHMLWPAVHQPRTLELLLERGADLKRAPGVLELATSINSLEAVNILLKHGADPDAKKDGIFTPLCTAIRDNRGNLVELLLAAGADPNLQASEFPAFKCITHKRAHLLPRILAAGANPSKPSGIVELAVAHDQKDALLILLESRVDPNARSSAGHTALTTAIRTNRLELLDILLAHGADPAVRGQEWPVSMAVKNPEILAKLLPYIQPSKIPKGALEMAVVADQIDSVKLLVDKGVSVEEKNGGVFSPLTTSIRENRKDIFQYLIDEAGADPNAPGEHLPIIKAIRRHREDDLSYIEHLIDRGADINLMYRGWNAVLQAVDNGDTKILQLLADRGDPDLSARDENDRSVREIMEERGLKEEEQILLNSRSPNSMVREANSQLRDLVQD